MKKIFLLFFVFSLHIFAQDKKSDLRIDLGCGIVGAYSPEVKEMKKAVAAGDTVSIRAFLFDKSLLKQICGAIAADEFSKTGKIHLTSKDKKRIIALKKSKVKFYVCSGCTGHFYGKVSQLLLSPKPLSPKGDTFIVSMSDASFGRERLREYLGFGEK